MPCVCVCVGYVKKVGVHESHTEHIAYVDKSTYKLILNLIFVRLTMKLYVRYVGKIIWYARVHDIYTKTEKKGLIKT